MVGVDAPEAVIGFSSGRGGRWFPVKSGIVVATEEAGIVADAAAELLHQANAKQDEKRLARVVGRWTRLCKRLSVRKQRMKEFGC